MNQRFRPESQRVAQLVRRGALGSEAGAGLYPGELCRFGTEPGVYETSTLAETPLAYPHQNRFHNSIGAVLGTETLCVRPSRRSACSASSTPATKARAAAAR